MISNKTQKLIDFALSAIEEEQPVMYDHKVFTTSEITREYFSLRLRGLEKECFDIAFLNNKHELLTCERMFTGTVNAAAIYPREVVKEALKHNACAVILAHNHPSGDPTPSTADNLITAELKDALALIDVRVLDHIIVGNIGVYSYKENGVL